MTYMAHSSQSCRVLDVSLSLYAHDKNAPGLNQMFPASQKSCWYLEPVCPVFDFQSWVFWCVFLVVLILIFCDVSYTLRYWWDSCFCCCNSTEPPGIRIVHNYCGLCLWSDMSSRHSMNTSARCLRYCELAFVAFQKSCRLKMALRAMNAFLVNSSNNIKFRKPLYFCQCFNIQTRVVWWDIHSLYVEQKIIRTNDSTLCAVNYSRHTVEGSDPQALLDLLPSCSCLPEVPPEIASWKVCIDVVNRELQMAGL